VRVIKSRKICWVGHVALMGEAYTGFFSGGNLGEGHRWGNPDLDGRIILRWIFKQIGCGRMDSKGLAQDRDRWRTLVSAVMNFRVQ